MVISIAYESGNDNQEKKIGGCCRIFCVGDDFAPPGPGSLGLENFFLDVHWKGIG